MSAPSPAPVSDFARLLVPVVLVTSERGREVFASTYRLFDRLDELSTAGRDAEIMAVWHGDRHCLTPEGVRTLNTFLRAGGLALFSRATRRAAGPQRGRHTRWSWRYLIEEYLGLDWEERS